MNKKQKRRQVQAKRLKQAENRELNRALELLHQAGNNPDLDVVAICKAASSRVLQHLTKAEVELPEGVIISNRLREAAANETIERTVLKNG